MALSSGTRLGPYEIVSPLGAGGMGEVYRARDTRLDRTVAIKILPSHVASDPDSRARFEREAKAVAALSHPHICPLFDVGHQNGTDFLVMEFLEGETLAARLRKGPLPIDQAIRFAIEIADALDKAHRQGIVHRDLKPGNVMLTKAGVKLLDFGLAKLRIGGGTVDAEATTLTPEGPLTGEGTILGTLHYMAPEQLEGKPADHRADIFAFGAVVYEMVTGKRAFDGDSHASVIGAILRDKPQPLTAAAPIAPASLSLIVEKCLAKDPDGRWQSAYDLKDSLTWVSKTRDPALTQPTRNRRRRTVAAAVIVTLIVVVVGGAVWLMKRSTGSPAWAGDQRTKLRQITKDAGLTFSPAITRDGRLIAYASDRTADQLDLWIQQVAGGDPIQITHHESNDYRPAFSPDGTTVVFRSDRDGGGIYLVSALGGAETLIAPKGLNPRFSPDGSTIVYWIGIEGSGDRSSPEWGQMFVVDRSGGKARRLAGKHSGRHPLWAPDGKHVLFISALQTRFDWCVVTVATDSVSCMDAEKVIGEHQHLSASDWVDDQLLYQADAGESADVWQVRIKPDYSGLIGPPVRVTYGSGEEVTPMFGSRGQVVFADVRATPDLWSVALDPTTGRSVSGGAERQLTHDLAMERNVSANRDGSKLLYTTNRTGTPDLWLRDLRTGSETRLTTGERTGWGLIHPSGLRAAYERLLPKQRNLRVIDIVKHENDEICGSEWCGSPMGWTSDGRWLVTQLGKSIRAVDMGTKRSIDILKNPPDRLWQPHLSPDDRWVAFLVKPAGNDGRIELAPFRGDGAIPHAEWRTIANTGTEDKPRWSADGRIIYFTSERDGFRCIWAQRVDPGSGKPVGEPFPAHHSHRPRLAMKELPLAPFDIWVANDQLFFNQLERTGNIWLLEPRPN